MTREPSIDDTASTHSAASPQNDVFGIDDTFVPPQAAKLPGITETSFDGLLDPPLLLHEDLKDGCGGQLWPAGMVLSRYMLTHHKTDLAGKAM
jgi:protein N-lysine methyltransferase METTL21A